MSPMTMMLTSMAPSSRISISILFRSSAYSKCLMGGFRQASNNKTVFVRRDVPKGVQLKSKTAKSQKSSTERWKQIAWFVKVTRIPALIGAIYTLGYQKGVVDTVRNPRKIQQGTFEQICHEMGCHSGDDIDIIWEKSPPPSLVRMGWFRLTNYDKKKTDPHEIKDSRTIRVATIGREIIRAARQYVKHELQKAIDKKAEELKDKGLSRNELLKHIIEEEEVAKWAEANERIEGYAEDGIHNWQYVLINTPVPNAFVTEMLPQRVFVTTGLFEEFVKNDDELAMIMGHEISHLIKGHSSEGNLIEFMFRGLEITFLMLDPTEGMLSLAIASFLASARNALLASNSREHEREADELGCKLAAMACFDTEKGANIFKRMHDFDVGKGGGGERNIMSSHPASMERYDFVRQLSKTVNPDHYSHCSTLQKQIRGRALTLLRGTKE